MRLKQNSEPVILQLSSKT